MSPEDSEGTLQGEAVVRKHVTVGVTTWHRHTIGHTSCQTRSSTGPLDQGCYPGGDFTAPPKSWHDLLMKAFACRCVDFLIRAEGSISKESDGWMPIREQRKPPTPRQPNPRPTQPKAHGRVSSSSNQSSSTLSLDTTSIFDATGSTSSFATTISPSESSPPSVRSLGSISDRDHRLSPVDSSTRSPIEKKALHSAPPTASLRSPTRSYPQTSTHNKNLGPLPPGPPGPNRALPTMLSSESSRPPRSRREAEQPKESLKPPKQA
ncbi:hypothetical protein BC834DRAFT_301244 [Gloeopeniophorella convolvens]|nr:hypothetical protein BC834DRAFT_301244 [Gloeopeniophorella convolvens]